MLTLRDGPRVTPERGPDVKQSSFLPPAWHHSQPAEGDTPVVFPDRSLWVTRHHPLLLPSGCCMRGLHSCHSNHRPSRQEENIVSILSRVSVCVVKMMLTPMCVTQPDYTQGANFINKAKVHVCAGWCPRNRQVVYQSTINIFFGVCMRACAHTVVLTPFMKMGGFVGEKRGREGWRRRKSCV